jgi:hypothetical protein
MRGIRRTDSSLSLDIDQAQDGQAVSFELGTDWFFGNWSPALSLSLSQQSLDIERAVRRDTDGVALSPPQREDLTGTDLGISASLIYYMQLSDSVLLAPSIGLFHLANLSGEVNGTFFAGPRRQNYQEELNAPADTSADIGLNLIVGDWLLSAGLLTSLSAEDSSDSWFMALSYSF